MEITLPKTLELRLNNAAKNVNKTPSALINAALKEVLDRHAFLDKAIKQGVESANKQPLIDHDDVWRILEKKREQHIKKQRKAA